MTWLYIPSTVLPSAPEPEALNSESTSPNPDIELCVMSSGKPTPLPLSWRGWKMRPWIKHLSGTTLPPSTAARGVEKWISSLADTPVRAKAMQASALEPQTSDGCGKISPASSMNASPGASFSKTLARTFLVPSPSSPKVWKAWVSGLRRDCLRRQKSAQAISVNASSSWPTIRANEGNAGGYQVDRNGNRLPTLNGSAEAWATPKTLTGGANCKGPGTSRKNGADLQQQIKDWPTPRACEGDKWSAGKQKADSLQQVSRAWPTPNLVDAKGGKRLGRSQAQLCHKIKDWEYPSKPPAPVTQDGPESSKSRRTLNPLFVEWLMSWPIGWTDCDSPVMEFTPWLRRMRIELSMLLSQPQTEPNGQMLLA